MRYGGDGSGLKCVPFVFCRAIVSSMLARYDIADHISASCRSKSTDGFFVFNLFVYTINFKNIITASNCRASSVLLHVKPMSSSHMPSGEMNRTY